MTDPLAAPRARKTAAKVERYRARLAAKGIRAHTVRCHDDDWPAIQSLARRMLEAREKEDKTDAG